MTSADCVRAIVQWCAANRSTLDREFVQPLTDQEWQAACAPKSWKRMSKGKTHWSDHVQGIERCFDCRPFDDQLRADVVTDPTDTTILTLTVQGE